MNKKWLLILASIGVIAGLLYFPLWQPLPALADIESIQAKFFLEDGKVVHFDLPSQYWKPLWSTILPARNDWNPSNWLVFGDLEIKLNNGSKYRVDLYQIREGAGGFSAGSTWETRSYYRGGNSEKMIEIIEQAYQDTTQNKP